MQDNIRATPHVMTLAAIGKPVVAAIAAFAVLSGGGVADAAGSGGPASSNQTLPVQSNDDQAAPDRDSDGHPCPEEEGGGGGGQGSGSGSSGEQAPSGSATPDTEL